MLLSHALELSEHTIVAAVGAGGKTTILQRLAAELAGRGACVVSTTTTAIWQPDGPVVVAADDALLPATSALVTPGRVITVAGARRWEADGPGRPRRAKLTGVSPYLPERLLALAGVSYVLVEADGARGRAIKAPAGHEPVIPPATTLVLAVVGIEALGEPLSVQIAHRPQRVAELLDITMGTPLSARHVAALLAHPHGGRKGVPAGARFVPFINKVQDEASLHGARAIAALLRGQAGVERVLIGAALSTQPVWEVWQ